MVPELYILWMQEEFEEALKSMEEEFAAPHFVGDVFSLDSSMLCFATFRQEELGGGNQIRGFPV